MIRQEFLVDVEVEPTQLPGNNLTPKSDLDDRPFDTRLWVGTRVFRHDSHLSMARGGLSAMEPTGTLRAPILSVRIGGELCRMQVCGDYAAGTFRHYVFLEGDVPPHGVVVACWLREWRADDAPASEGFLPHVYRMGDDYSPDNLEIAQDTLRAAYQVPPKPDLNR